jgi:hypothetical protein
MKRYQLVIFIAIVILVPLGFASKFYRGPLDDWFNNSLGGVLYEMFWVWLAVLIWPHLSPIWTAVWVFIITSILEILQLWNPPILAMMRSHIVGRLLLGTTFSWWDFVYYIIGCVLAAWLLILAKKKVWTHKSET